ncbi:MAG: hypothetical protein MK033_12665 [Candidatus Caenarcaniphilales bacterium]|nr:hypothetical protein [Candidatus Caenarcaniphilales bacterium]
MPIRSRKVSKPKKISLKAKLSSAKTKAASTSKNKVSNARAKITSKVQSKVSNAKTKVTSKAKTKISPKPKTTRPATNRLKQTISKPKTRIQNRISDIAENLDAKVNQIIENAQSNTKNKKANFKEQVSALHELKEDIKNKMENLVDKAADNLEELVEKNSIKFWNTTARNFKFPETTETNFSKKADLGFCFSGGGTRSASATIGQLRALNNIKTSKASKKTLLNSSKYISAISGGAWASTTFTFLPKNVSDDTFLGKYVEPSKLIANDIFSFKSEKNFLNQVSTSKMLVKALKNYLMIRTKIIKGIHFDEVDETFSRTIAEVFLKAYGLDEAKKYFTWTKANLNEILKRNPHLEASDFNWVDKEQERPFFIAGGVMNPPDKSAEWNHFEMTPLYSGISKERKAPRKTQKSVGGAYLESFAMDSQSPNKKVTGNKAEVRQGKAFHRMSVSEIMAVTGAAPAFVFQGLQSFENSKMLHDLLNIPYPGTKSKLTQAIAKLSGVNMIGSGKLDNSILATFPEFRYWTPQEAHRNEEKYDFGDGGYIDSYGIIPLLKRGVENIVVFMNTTTAINNDSSKAKQFSHAIQVDTALPVLFGEKVPKSDLLASNISKKAQVFVNKKNTEDATTPYEETVRGLLSASNFDKLKLKKGQKLNGRLTRRDFSKFSSASEQELSQYLGCIKGPVYHKQQYQVIKNEFFGIEKPYKVNILWVNLERSWTWEALLPSKWSNTIAKDNSERIAKLKSKPEFYNFPNYSTFNTNPNSSMVNLVDMNPSQANMMAHLTAWVTKQLEPVLLDMFAQ